MYWGFVCQWQSKRAIQSVNRREIGAVERAVKPLKSGFSIYYEISLHKSNGVCSVFNGKPLIFSFVTNGLSRGYKQACKRCPFAL